MGLDLRGLDIGGHSRIAQDLSQILHLVFGAGTNATKLYFMQLTTLWVEEIANFLVQGLRHWFGLASVNDLCTSEVNLSQCKFIVECLKARQMKI